MQDGVANTPPVLHVEGREMIDVKDGKRTATRGELVQARLEGCAEQHPGEHVGGL